ncbi:MULTISPECIES: ATP-binding protein [Rhodococcus]|jgi:MoxR-like ATPase|uniref:ATP-binding protein n=1 Tax=Rhodococcus TaxID=1827 RepID=UPI00110F40FC|nr:MULTISPECIES: AAA family ATPase [Rhodococcus]MCF8786145.1 AAA family ATPase [Rhodococcus ruber]
MASVTFAAWACRDLTGPTERVHAAVTFIDPYTGDPHVVSAFGSNAQFEDATLILRDEPPTRNPQRVFAELFQHYYIPDGSTTVSTSEHVLRPPQVCFYEADDTPPVNPRSLFAMLATTSGTVVDDPLAAADQALTISNDPVRGATTTSFGTPADARALMPIPAEDADGVLLPDGRRYWPRSIAGMPDYLVLRKLRGVMNIRLKGLPGAGKTTLPAAAFGSDLITIQGHGDLTVSALAGHYQPHPDGSFIWCDGPLTRAMKEGKVLLFDEVNRAPSETIAALLSIADSRGQLVLDDRPDQPPVIASPGFGLIITYNEEGQGVRPLDDAIKRRFPFEITVETDYTIAEAAGIDGRLVKIGRNLLERHVNSMADGGFPVWRPQMADLLATQQILDAGLGAEMAAATLTAACTNVDDFEVVTDVVARAFGLSGIRPLQLGSAL